MALLIRPEHRHRLTSVLDGVFRLRQRVFVERLGWELPSNDGSREIDAYDDGGCFHLAVLDGDGVVRATNRLTASLEPNVSCDVLQQQMGGRPFPRAAHIVEGSRVCVDPDLPQDVRHEVTMDLRAAAWEFRKMMGWTHMIGVGYETLMLRWIRTGMAVEVLSGPTMFPGDKEIAMGFLSWEDPDRPNVLTDYLGARHNALQDPARDPSLLARFGDRTTA